MDLRLRQTRYSNSGRLIKLFKLIFVWIIFTFNFKIQNQFILILHLPKSRKLDISSHIFCFLWPVTESFIVPFITGINIIAEDKRIFFSVALLCVDPTEKEQAYYNFIFKYTNIRPIPAQCKRY